MLERYLACGMLLSLVACGGGGGNGEADYDDGFGFKDRVPGEAELCTLVVDVSTRIDAQNVLGEPTQFSEDQNGSIWQYWYGSLQQFGMGDIRTIVLSFDAAGVFTTPSVDGLPFPQCWRDQLAAQSEF